MDIPHTPFSCILLTNTKNYKFVGNDGNDGNVCNVLAAVVAMLAIRWLQWY